MAIVFEAPSASYTPDRCLQGKSLPSARSGELSRVDLPYGVGVSIIMWEFTEATQRRSVVAMALKESLVESIVCEICVSGVWKEMNLESIFVPDEKVEKCSFCR
jgi:hypothetical protein